jgi:hypothetical protein
MIPVASFVPALLQVGVQVPHGGELPGKTLGFGRQLAPGIEIASAEQVGSGNNRRPHRPVFIRSLRPRNVFTQPEIEAHRPYLTTGQRGNSPVPPRQLPGFRSGKAWEE